MKTLNYKWQPTHHEKHLWLEFQSSQHDAGLFVKFLQATEVLDILFYKMTSNKIINPFAFWLPFRLCEVFCRFPSLTNENNSYKQKLVQCIMKIVESMTKSIKNPFVLKSLISNVDSDFEMWDEDYFEYAYFLLNEQQQYDIMSKIITCALATSCETFPISCMFLKRWILKMSVGQLKQCVIKWRFLYKIGKILQLNTKSLSEYGLGYCSYNNIKINKVKRAHSIHKELNKCKSYHANILFFQVIQGIISRCVEFTQEQLPEYCTFMFPNNIGDVWCSSIVHKDLIVIMKEIIKTDVIKVCLKQMEYNISEVMYIHGYKGLIHLFKAFDHFDCHQESNCWVLRDYLLFNTDYLKMLCKMINIAHNINYNGCKQEKTESVNIYQLINDVSEVITRLILRNENETNVHNFDFSTKYAKCIVTCLNKHLNITAQEFINYLVLTMVLDCNVNQHECIFNQSKNSATMNLYSMLDAKEWFESLFPYSNCKKYNYSCTYNHDEHQNLKNNTKMNDCYRICHSIVLHRGSHQLQRKFLQNRHMDGYGFGCFGSNVGNFGILFYAICNVENLMLLFEPINRQCVRNVRTSMIMFTRYIKQTYQLKSVYSNCNYNNSWDCDAEGTKWETLMNDVCCIYSFYNISMNKLKISKKIKMNLNDIAKLNENYQFVTKYIEKFIIKMTGARFSKQLDGLWHIEKQINYILSISYAFLGRMDAYWYREKLLECQIDTDKNNNVHNVFNIDLMINYGLKMKPNCSIDSKHVYQRQRQLLKHLQHIILNDKKESKQLHKNNLIAMGYVHQNKQTIFESSVK